MASNINGAIPIAGTPMYAEPIQANFLTAKNEITALQNTLGVGGEVGTFPWTWSAVYADPANYTGRVVAAGASAYLPIASGAWPPNYVVSNGTTVGGVPPTGVNNGTLPIRIQPPISGVGRLKFVVLFKAVIINQGSVAGSFALGLGTNNSSQNNKPMFPYLGVGHDLSTGSETPITVQPNEAKSYVCFRLDVVDNALVQDTPIATWPVWTMDYNTTTLLYPAVDAEFINHGTTALMINNILAWGVAC